MCPNLQPPRFINCLICHMILLMNEEALTSRNVPGHTLRFYFLTSEYITEQY